MRLALFPIGDMTQGFGANPRLYRPFDMEGHNGIDLVRPHGEHMFAVEDGTVIDVKDTPEGYGMHVRLISKDGKREWTYGHCASIHVKQDQQVKGGQFIARMGNTGFVVSGNTPFWGHNPYAGTHLHLGLRLSRFDPRGWSYPGSKIKFMVDNYNNGFKGSVDPLPYLRDQSLLSTRVENYARDHKHASIMGMSVRLRQMGL
jgi:murein DD-endopeptidase MepM/ murein hydrolase activator NlpD